jgi:SAM-dependent methyltransferase
METHQLEVTHGRRFEFGANWTRFLKSLNEDRIRAAENALMHMLEIESLKSKSFLDIGSGSGLFSLAARRLGARVHSFDYDPLSVACTAELKRRYFPDDTQWHIEEASVLDRIYLDSLGKFDVLYSWGALHHTGAMWQALENVTPLVAEGGKLFIAIYNDQGRKSRWWLEVKRAYNRAPWSRPLWIFGFWPYFVASRWIVRRIGNLPLERGMHLYWDMVDWLGGYPFEVARPEQIFDFYRKRGFHLVRLKTCGAKLGCNEFIFARLPGECI